MPDDQALRQRRSRQHRLGDHSLCRPERCKTATPLKVVESGEGLDSGGLVASYERRLRDAGRLDTPEAEQVLGLARVLAGGGHTAAGYASLSRELRATAAEALRGAPQAADGLDELAERRRQRAHG